MRLIATPGLINGLLGSLRGDEIDAAHTDMLQCLNAAEIESWTLAIQCGIYTIVMLSRTSPYPKTPFFFYIYCLVVATEERIEEQHGDLNRGGGPPFIYFPFCAIVDLPDYDRWVGAFGRPGRLSPP